MPENCGVCGKTIYRRMYCFSCKNPVCIRCKAYNQYIIICSSCKLGFSEEIKSKVEHHVEGMKKIFFSSLKIFIPFVSILLVLIITFSLINHKTLEMQIVALFYIILSGGIVWSICLGIKEIKIIKKMEHFFN